MDGADPTAGVRDAIARGDDDDAFRHLRRAIGWPHGRALSASELAPYATLLAALAERRDATELAQLAAAVAADPEGPDRLYDLGYALIDAGAPTIAASLLARALELVPDSEEIVCELTSALESSLLYADACALLARHAELRARSFLCRYLYAFNAAMSGQLAITRDVLPALAPDSPESGTMQAAIAAIVERAARLGADPGPRDLRGWHYVLSGGVLLHVSPYGFETPMHGRYAWLHDSMARVATGLERLCALIGELPAPPPCVYAPPGRDHEIVAHALAAKLHVAVAPWPAIGVPAPGLVAIYDLATLAPAEAVRLVPRKPDQLVFAHAARWTADGPVAPDVTTLLHQQLVPPWNDDVRPAEVIAAELAAAPGLDDDERAADDPQHDAAVVSRAWPPAAGVRARWWAGGPVPSNKFE
jgi:cytochrome c-type biogenesis protein CcmH/NrfG